MDTRQLKYFVQIVESGSLSAASRQLFIAQPALSQQMTRLEEEVGKPLLVRSVRGVSPTENGIALYHHAKFILRQLDQAMDVARRDYFSVSGRVTIGLAPTTVCALGLPLMRHLRSKYPGIVLNIVEGLSGHLEHMARMDQFDLAILFSGSAASDMVVKPLLEEELFVILPHESKLIASDRKDISLQELLEIPLILPSPGHGLRKRISIEFDRVSMNVDPVAEIDSLPLLMRCVADGVGATIKPQAAIHALGNNPEQWRCLRISNAKMTRPNFLYTLPPEKMSTSAIVVCDEIQTVVHNLVKNGKWGGVQLASVSTLFHPEDTCDNAVEV